MNNKFFLFFILISFSLVHSNKVFSQTKYELSAQVKDGNNRQPLEFATVVILADNDSLIASSTTNHKGYFTTMVSEGTHTLKIKYLGYETYSQKISISKNIYLGTVNMQPSSQNLKAVEVKTSTRENKLDRDVILVSSKLKNGASNTKEVLERINGVQYNRFKNSISVDNDPNIILLVDGMEKNEEYIKNIEPERIQKVEIIRDPSGKYGMDGYSAVVNIILKSNFQGTDLYSNTMTVIDFSKESQPHIFPNIWMFLSLNHTVGKWNFYADINVLHNDFFLEQYKKITYTSGLEIENKTPSETRNFLVKSFGNDYNIGFDYKINPKHTLSVEVASDYWKSNEDENILSIYKKEDSVFNSIEYKNTNHIKSNPKSGNFYYVGKINKRVSLNVNFKYSNDARKNTHTITSEQIASTQETINSSFDNIKTYAEVNYDITDVHALLVGYGYYRAKSTQSIFKQSVVEQDFTDQYSKNRMYAYYSFRPFDKLGIKTGVSAEFTRSANDQCSNNFKAYNPTLNIHYKPWDFFDVRLKYRTSTQFPELGETNPIATKLNIESIQYGNPNLKPSLAHRASLRMNIMQGLLSIEPYYRFSHDRIAQIGNLQGDSLIVFTYDNIGKYQKKGIKLNFVVPFASFLVWQNNLDLYASQMTYAEQQNKLKDFSLQSYLMYINKKTSTLVIAGLQRQNSRFITAQGYQNYNNDIWAITVQQSFFKERLSIMVGYILPISWGVNKYQEDYQKTVGYTSIARSDLSILENMIMCKVSLRLSKGQTREKLFQNTEDNDNQPVKKTIF